MQPDLPQNLPPKSKRRSISAEVGVRKAPSNLTREQEAGRSPSSPKHRHKGCCLESLNPPDLILSPPLPSVPCARTPTGAPAQSESRVRVPKGGQHLVLPLQNARQSEGRLLAAPKARGAIRCSSSPRCPCRAGTCGQLEMGGNGFLLPLSCVASLF